MRRRRQVAAYFTALRLPNFCSRHAAQTDMVVHVEASGRRGPVDTALSNVARPQTSPHRWSPPAQRADQAADHRGVPGAAAGQSARCRRLCRSPSAPAIPCARSSSAFPTSTRCASRRPTTASPRPLALAPPRHADGDRQTRMQVPGRDPRPYLRARRGAVARAAVSFADQDETGNSSSAWRAAARRRRAHGADVPARAVDAA